MDAVQLVHALSVAWGGVHLYPDPKSVPAFLNAVESIGEAAGGGLVLAVTVDGFEHRSEPVAVHHGAGDRLVQALFALRVDSVAIMAPPTPDEVIEFFSTLQETDDIDDVALDLDFSTRLQLAGLNAIRVHCHDPLEDRDEDEEEPDDVGDRIERPPEIEALFAGDSVGTLVDRFMEAGSPAAAAEDFVAVYVAMYDKVGAGDAAGLGRVVQTFADAFFRLDHAYRAAVFREVLEASTLPAVQNFLDQFSPNELAELTGELDDAALPLLVEYARVVAQMQGHDQGIVEQVQSGRGESGATREAVASTVGLRLAKFLEGDEAHAGAAASLRTEVEALAGAPRVGWSVLEDLLTIEDRSDRLRRLLRIWTAKLAGAIKARTFDDALRWLHVVTDQPFDVRELDQAFDRVASNEVMSILTASGEDREARDELLTHLSRRSAGRVLDQLATEEDPGRRRLLIDIVTEIARVDIRSVLPGLSDPRWYVVRNLVIALGKSGRKAAGEPLARLARHDDHRVRIEALRALIPCLGDAAVDYLVAALADDHVRVRAAASDLLEVVDDVVVVPALRSVLGNDSAPIEVRVAVVETLGKRTDEEAQLLLREVADTKARFSSSARALRTAAREALRPGHA